MATMTSKTEATRVGRFDVVHCDADDDGPEGWEIREGEDVLDSEETWAAAVRTARRMETERVSDEAAEMAD
jgi:hypothetical protein